jgi:ATP-dependent Clp protease ATP-binding subunit ClpA
MNNDFNSAVQQLLPQSMLDRLKTVTIAPLNADVMEKIVDQSSAKMLQGGSLNDRQRDAATKFLREKAMEGFDPSQGARGVRQRAKNAFTSAAFGALMHEHSSETLLRGMTDAFMGAKTAVTAPATAKFTRRRTP